ARLARGAQKETRQRTAARPTSRSTSPGRRSAKGSTRSSTVACRPTSPPSSAHRRSARRKSGSTIVPPPPAELDRMRDDVRVAMREGAMGLTTALIYTPAVFSKTDELVALAKVASESGGMYIAHIRSEGDRLLEAIDETIDIAKQASIPAEIYHLKAAGRSNLGKMTQAIAK